MSSRGPDDRDDAVRRTGRPDAPAPVAPGDLPPTDAPPVAEEIGETADPDAAPPVHRDEGARQDAPVDVRDAGSPGPPRYDRFGWPLPAGMNAGSYDERPAQPTRASQPPPGQPVEGERPPTYNPYDTSAWRVPPAPSAPPGPYSGQFPAQPPAPDQSPRGPYSGQFPAQRPPGQSGAFPIPPADAARRSGAFPMVPDPAMQGGTYAALPAPSPDDPHISGPVPQSIYASGPMSQQIRGAAVQAQQSDPLAYPGEVTSTGSRRVIVAHDPGLGSLLTDWPALAFLLAAVLFAGAMIAYIAVRYAHFPEQIALHFGPAGTSQPTRIGEKRELWTIPFIVGIVLAADTALAWAVYRYDRFAARLLTLGSALVAAIAWVVLLTLLHR